MNLRLGLGYFYCEVGSIVYSCITCIAITIMIISNSGYREHRLEQCIEATCALSLFSLLLWATKTCVIKMVNSSVK